jgi:hypothetical protein
LNSKIGCSIKKKNYFVMHAQNFFFKNKGISKINVILCPLYITKNPNCIQGRVFKIFRVTFIVKHCIYTSICVLLYFPFPIYWTLLYNKVYDQLKRKHLRRYLLRIIYPVVFSLFAPTSKDEHTSKWVCAYTPKANTMKLINI